MDFDKIDLSDITNINIDLDVMLQDLIKILKELKASKIITCLFNYYNDRAKSNPRAKARED